MEEMFMEISFERPTLTDEQKNMLLGGTKERPAMMGMPTAPVYEHESSRYPERIRVKFFDGSTKVYELHTEQPEPMILENIEIIRKWKTGYQYQPPRRRRGRK